MGNLKPHPCCFNLENLSFANAKIAVPIRHFGAERVKITPMCNRAPSGHGKSQTEIYVFADLLFIEMWS